MCVYPINLSSPKARDRFKYMLYIFYTISIHFVNKSFIVLGS